MVTVIVQLLLLEGTRSVIVAAFPFLGAGGLVGAQTGGTVAPSASRFSLCLHFRLGWLCADCGALSFSGQMASDLH